MNNNDYISPTPYVTNIEQGMALVKMEDDAIFVPAGTWHNIINIGRTPLRVSSVYAPPHHPSGTVQRTKEEAQEDY